MIRKPGGGRTNFWSSTDADPSEMNNRVTGCLAVQADLAAFLDARGVAKYKFPERVEIRSELPTTPDGGKILRRALEDDITGLLMSEGAI